jgi:hypothetical protein
MEWLHEFPLMIPIVLPFIGVHSHNPSIDVKPHSLEKISILAQLTAELVELPQGCLWMRKMRIEIV